MLKKWITKRTEQKQTSEYLQRRKTEHEQFLETRARLRAHEISNNDLQYGENHSVERRFFRAKYAGHTSEVSVHHGKKVGDQIVEYRWGREIKKGERTPIPEYLYLYLEGKCFYEFFSGNLVGELTAVYVKSRDGYSLELSGYLYPIGLNTYLEVYTGKIHKNIPSYKLIKKGCICRRKWHLFNFGEYYAFAPSEDLQDYMDWDIKELTATGFAEEVSKYMPDKEYIIEEMNRYVRTLDEEISRKEVEQEIEVSKDADPSWLNDYIDQRI